jgi:hypothetical protein
MHDVDRTQLEYSSEISEYGEFSENSSGPMEFGESGTVLDAVTGEGEGSNWETGYGESSIGEIMEDELASELLEISNEAELDHFLGSLISKATKGVGRFMSSSAGKALGGILKQVAKKVLPIAGGALGTFVGGPAGAALGGKLASMAGDAFGLEAEGLSPEDRDFEVAKRYVRFAHDAARRVADAPPRIHPSAAARMAVIESAKRHAPGLLAPVNSGSSRPVYRPDRPYPAVNQVPYDQTQPTCPGCSSGQGLRGRQGRWIRRGRHIVLLGV